MTTEELLSTWLEEPDAFEIFNCHGITNEQVEEVLGKDAAQGYSTWVYLNIK